MDQASSKAVVKGKSDHLLHLYLSLPADRREQMFPGTTRAAKLVGIPRRTIQFWVEIGKIEAISVGRKYKVHLESLLALIQSHVNEQ
jgi:excisionase family DNA binding protein